MIYLRFEADKAVFDCNSVEKTPIDYVLIGVALCLGSELIDMGKQSDFINISVGIGNGTLKILGTCRESSKVDFMQAVSDCYIIHNLKFKVFVDLTTY